MKNLTINDVKNMNVEQLELALNSNTNLTPAVKRALQVRLESLKTEPAPVEQAPEQPTQEQAAPTVKPAKNKPYETTRTIEAFKDDTKGIRAGSKVTFRNSNRPDGKVITGTVQRLFDFYLKPERQEAKIKGDDGQRYYRFEKDLQVAQVDEVQEGAGI